MTHQISLLMNNLLVLISITIYIFTEDSSYPSSKKNSVVEAGSSRVSWPNFLSKDNAAISILCEDSLADLKSLILKKINRLVSGKGIFQNITSWNFYYKKSKLACSWFYHSVNHLSKMSQIRLTIVYCSNTYWEALSWILFPIFCIISMFDLFF